MKLAWFNFARRVRAYLDVCHVNVDIGELDGHGNDGGDRGCIPQDGGAVVM